MNMEDFGLGLTLMLLVGAALTRSAYILRRLLLPHWHGAPALLAQVVLTLSILLVLLQVLGFTSVLTAPALLLTCLGVTAGIELLARRVPPHSREGPIFRGATPGSSRWSVTIALAASVWVFIDWFVLSLPSLEHGVHGGDSLWYHLPFAANFAQEGSITGLHYTGLKFLSWFYPANSELLGAAWIVLSNGDAIAPVLNLFWLTLAMLAAWCIGRPLGVAPLTLVAVTLLFASTALTASQPGLANNDTMGVALALSAVAVVINGWDQGVQSPSKRLPTGALVVAGSAAGIAIGTKLMMVLPMLCLAAGIIALSRARRRTPAFLILVPTLVVTGGFWYGRNFFATGNPLPWKELSLGPLSLPSPDATLGGAKATAYSVANYWNDPVVWVDWFIPGLTERFGTLWPLIFAAAAAGALFALLRGPSRAHRLIGAVAIIAAATYVLMPLSAEGPRGMPVNFDGNLRQSTLALALGLTLLPTAWRIAPFAARHATPLCGIAVVTLLITATPTALLTRISDILTPVNYGSAIAIATVGLGIALLTLVVFAVVGRVPSKVTLAILGGLVGTAIVGGGVLAVRNMEQRYTSNFSILRHTTGIEAAFSWAQEVRGARIGTTSILQYGLYGSSLDNEVEYIGSPGSDGTFSAIATCEMWRIRVNEAKYDYVVSAPTYKRRSYVTPRSWIRSPVSTRVAHDKNTSIYQINGLLDPRNCKESP